ncbi:MAG: polyamine aminopropyltransferase [Thermaerobacter sp.]|nr:polyamine aminopropyltransferase [Thermaerobacter sp.]
MNTWFTEQQTESVRLGLKISSIVWQQRTPFQELVVAETDAFGRMLVLDGAVQTTVADEFVYHEMITHVPLFAHPHPRKVAVIGGGDGGAIREILKHPEVEEAHLVEIDGQVIDAARRFFPTISRDLDDKRAFLHVTDGIEWVRQARGFDVMIVDSTDPVGPAEGLFAPPFYRSIAEALNPDGILVAQSESPFLNASVVRRVVSGVRASFPVTRLYLAAIPTYPSGLWSFTLGSKTALNAHGRHQQEVLTAPTRYWTPALQESCFALPRFVEELIG